MSGCCGLFPGCDPGRGGPDIINDSDVTITLSIVADGGEDEVMTIEPGEEANFYLGLVDGCLRVPVVVRDPSGMELDRHDLDDPPLCRGAEWIIGGPEPSQSAGESAAQPLASR